MKKIHAFFATAMCSTLALTSCVKEVINDDKQETATPNSFLQIRTRGENDTLPVPQGRFYLFNASGTCVNLLTIDADNQSATAKLPEGQYQIYAIGSNDLSCFDLPIKADATPESIIQLKTDETMNDLLMKQQNVTLVKDEPQNLNITLDRKVINITNISIKQVPDTISKVEVAIKSLYTKVQLNGTYPDETDDYQVTLTEADDSTTWQATPNQMSFPSKGNPIVEVTFTHPTGTKTYTYTSDIPFSANHKVSIEGTYTETGDIELTASMSAPSWVIDAPVIFEFNETNKTSSTTSPTSTPLPAVGSTYEGCYVLATDSATRKVTLLSTSEENQIATGTDATTHTNAINSRLASWEEFSNLSGTKRVPTADEISLFGANTSLVSLSTGNSKFYYCMDAGTLKRIEVKRQANGTNVIKNPEATLAPANYLRPVIDITF